MIYNYNCVEQKVLGENLKEYAAYGIALGSDILIKDVTCDKNFAEDIVKKLNAFQASPAHIFEIVENMIIQKYS